MVRLSIRRPVAVAMGYLAVGLLGIAAWRNIPIELLPQAELPRLTVNAEWRGASPETVEAFLTSPLEASIQLIQGVEKVTSTSEENRASIEVEFDRDTDMDFARLDLSERLATLEESELPAGVDRVTVEPYIPEEFADQVGSFLVYTFTGSWTLEALREHLIEYVQPALSQIEGVAVVRVQGGLDRLLEVEIDADRLAALGLDPDLVTQRISELDLVREAGSVRQQGQEWTVTIRNRPGSAQDILDAVVDGKGGRLVRVSDVAQVRDTYEEARSYYRVNGRPAVSVFLDKTRNANTVRVADAVKAEMKRIEGSIPPNTRFVLDRDESEDIRNQMSDLRSRAMVSAVVIFMVLLIFLRSFRSAAVIFATIAFSILIALNLIYFGGLSLNLLTLMGLAMGFGLIVDNSIVVLENVYRRWQRGEDIRDAAETGTVQVILPIVAATSTTLIVFVPFVYLQGELRVFYLPLAMVVVLTLLASLLVSFTFIPALASRVFMGTPRAPADGSEAAPRAPLYERFYRGMITITLGRPWITVALSLILLGGSYHLFDTYVSRGRIWGGGAQGRSSIRLQITLPRGSDLSRTDELTVYFEERLRLMPEVEQFVSYISPTNSRTTVTFPDSLENTGIPAMIKDQLFAFSLGFTGAKVRVYGYGPSFYGGGGGAPNYSIQILGYNYERVRDIAEDLGVRLTRLARVRDVDTNAMGGFFRADRASEFVVEIDRDALARYDMDVADAVRQINAAVPGFTGASNRIKLGGDEVRFSVKLEGNRDVDLVEFRETMLLTGGGQPVRLGDLVSISNQDLLSRIIREDQQYMRTVAYEFRGPNKLGDKIHDETIAGIQPQLPAGYTVKAADRWRWSVEEQTQIYMVLALSVLLIYMVTGALFESMLLPLAVLLTVPMALIGVFLIFFYTGASFTREAYIGVVMMGGIVVNNSILLVDHINRIRSDNGKGLREAILEGTIERVRPILMTTTTTVLGLLPLVLFSASADANIWNALAYALIGGLLSSTFLVLTVTPALYLLFQQPRKVRARVAAKPPLQSVPAEQIS